MKYNLNNPIAQRKYKTVYRDNDKTIKLFVENYSKADILNEALNNARVEETGLNIPKLLEVTKIENRWALVYEHIEGETLEELMQKNPDKKDEYMKLFVDTQMNILSKEGYLVNRLKDKTKRKIEEANIDTNTKYELNTRLEGMRNHKKLCHGDFNPSNVVIKPNGEVYVIDPRYFNDNLSDFVDKHKITDVIFINNMIAVGSQNRVDELNKLLK